MVLVLVIATADVSVATAYTATSSDSEHASCDWRLAEWVWGHYGDCGGERIGP